MGEIFHKKNQTQNNTKFLKIKFRWNQIQLQLITYNKTDNKFLIPPILWYKLIKHDIHLSKDNKIFARFNHHSEFKMKMNVWKCIIKLESKLQINCYENKNWNENYCYNWNNLLL